MKKPRILDYVIRQAATNPANPAIMLSNKRYMTYQQLETQVGEVSQSLLKMGLGLNQRIAVVMSNGPEMIVAFYAISNVASFVPLNPAYSVEEFKNYMEIIRIDAVLLEEGNHQAALLAALELSIPIILLRPCKTEVLGTFHLISEELAKSEAPFDFARGDDIAVVLHTSGTTAQPKIVPLTQANLYAVVENSVRLFNLSEKDRCINVIPLFHIYGIAGPVLSSAAAGGSVICTPSFEPDEFFRVLDEMSPTWYAASPTIHQVVAQYAEKAGTIPSHYALNLIRSGGAPLPIKVLEKLEKHFGAKVLQGYGLTETSSMATGNPPGKNKPGSVGIAIGCEVGIMGSQGQFLSPGHVGQIAIRGPGVTAGYENDEYANSVSFVNGWFATGDQGYLDDDGYLFITGRIKEIINRGGVKVSPYEVEDVLNQHPDVIEAAVFAVPHKSLGEDLAAMVILRPASSTTPLQLRIFLTNKIAPFKIPNCISVVDKIPRGPMGKVQRRLLYRHAQELACKSSSSTNLNGPDIDYPWTKTEEKLACIWKKLLNIEVVGINDDFFELGGNSLLAAILATEIEQTFGKNIPLNTIIEQRTIQQYAAVLCEEAAASSHFQFLVTIKPGGTRSPLFLIHAIDGEIFAYRKLAAYLVSDQPVYGLWFNRKATSLRYPIQISDLAHNYIQELRLIQPQGPYYLAGHSLGGLIAYEISIQLQAQKQNVALLAMFDTWTLPKNKPLHIWKRCKKSFHKYSSVPFNKILLYSQEKLMQELGRIQRKILKMYRNKATPPPNPSELPSKTLLWSALRSYLPNRYDGTITYFKSEDHDGHSADSLSEWSKLATEIRVFQAPGKHVNMIIEPHVQELAGKLNDAIQAAANQR